VIDEDWTVSIGGKSIDKTVITSLSKNQIAQENQGVKDLCNQDAYIRIEAFRGEKRTDPLSDSRSEFITGQTHYVPTKEDCDQAIRQLHDEGQEGTTELVLDRIEQNLTSRGIQLRSHWRIMTEANMKVWSRG
jgi:patatin-like phospholipase/acyl hydrolase